ncbi:MAG: type II toxin-antitoxin system RelE/ParE family toxin [Deltaproteobacteria bacterium]
MGRYKIVFSRPVAKDFKNIPRADARRVLAAIERLAEEPRPRGAKKLSGQERYRIRQGNLRILYAIDDGTLIITVVRVRNRRDVYR